MLADGWARTLCTKLSLVAEILLSVARFKPHGGTVIMGFRPLIT